MNNFKFKNLSGVLKKTMLFLICLCCLSTLLVAQVQRTVDGGMSIIRASIPQYREFNFFRDWSNTATFKSGLGETVEFFPVVFSVPEKSIELFGLQLDAEVKPRNPSAHNAGSIINLVHKDFIKRSIFIDKIDVARMISYMEREIIPNLKSKYKKKSKEYVIKTKELFFSFLIDENTARITMHIVDYGPLGDAPEGDQIEFWTETKISEIPEFLDTIKKLYSTMK